MTFWGLGYHQYRERWIHQEWFWYQTTIDFSQQQETLNREEALDLVRRRKAELKPYFGDGAQTALGRMFEDLADMVDDDSALKKMQDLGLL